MDLNRSIRDAYHAAESVLRGQAVKGKTADDIAQERAVRVWKGADPNYAAHNADADARSLLARAARQSGLSARWKRRGHEQYASSDRMDLAAKACYDPTMSVDMDDAIRSLGAEGEKVIRVYMRNDCNARRASREFRIDYTAYWRMLRVYLEQLKGIYV
jgi:hypothetical protein